MSDNDDYVHPDPEVSRGYFEEMGARAGEPLSGRSISLDTGVSSGQSRGRTHRQPEPIADFQRRFLQALALLYPPETHTRW